MGRRRFCWIQGAPDRPFSVQVLFINEPLFPQARREWLITLTASITSGVAGQLAISGFGDFPPQIIESAPLSHEILLISDVPEGGSVMSPASILHLAGVSGTTSFTFSYTVTATLVANPGGALGGLKYFVAMGPSETGYFREFILGNQFPAVGDSFTLSDSGEVTL